MIMSLLLSLCESAALVCSSDETRGTCGATCMGKRLTLQGKKGIKRDGNNVDNMLDGALGERERSLDGGEAVHPYCL